MEQRRIDWPSFALCAAIVVVASLFLIVFPVTSAAVREDLYGYIVREFGTLYLLASIAALGFLAWLGVSRFGAVRRGRTIRQVILLLVSLPILLTGVVMSVVLVKSLREDIVSR